MLELLNLRKYKQEFEIIIIIIINRQATSRKMTAYAVTLPSAEIISLYAFHDVISTSVFGALLRFFSK